MHIFDYSFLENIILPTNISALLQSLWNMQAFWARTGGQKTDPEILRQDLTKDRALLPVEESLAFSAYSSVRKAGVDPLLAASCLTLDLLCLSSPSLALAHAQSMLRQEGFTLCGRLSLEDTIARYPAYFQRETALSKQRWEENENDYLIYIAAFLSLLYLSARKLLPLPAPEAFTLKEPAPEKAPRHKNAKPAAPRRNTKRAMVEEMVRSSAQPVSKAEICAALPQVSPTTVEAALGAMVKSGAARRIGPARTARYIGN